MIEPSNHARRFDRPLVAWKPRAIDRAAARLRAHRLDEALAAGVPSESSPALALRARQLIALPYRRSIASSYRRVVVEGQAPSQARVGPCRARIAAASGRLVELADTLSRPGPVAPRGVAEASLLLADGTGPIYSDRSRGDLEALAARATAHLELRPAEPAR